MILLFNIIDKRKYKNLLKLPKDMYLVICCDICCAVYIIHIIKTSDVWLQNRENKKLIDL